MEKSSGQETVIPEQIKILILGDSLTDGYGVSREQAYPAQLEKILQKQGLQVRIINAGSSGSTSASALERLQWHMQAKPDILLLALGGNDGLRGVSITATFENLARTIDLAKANDIRVFLASMKLPYNYGQDYRTSFEGMYERLVQDKDIQAVPFMLEGVGGVKEMNLPDGIHPNEQGHVKIANNMATFFLSELP
ncbi:MAG: arylesterase [Deltaproteobacteria bacterium]|nr:arylesterase [Deltaproteobacteria bacterium]